MHQCAEHEISQNFSQNLKQRYLEDESNILLSHTTHEENKRRRTVVLQRSCDKHHKFGFTIQTYGIKRTSCFENLLNDTFNEVFMGDENLPKSSIVIDMISFIDYVEFDSPAFYSGLKRGDVILAINGKSMEDTCHDDLIKYISTQNVLRMVVLFEDCAQKIDLNLRVYKLKEILKVKRSELDHLFETEGELVNVLRQQKVPELEPILSNPLALIPPSLFDNDADEQNGSLHDSYEPSFERDDKGDNTNDESLTQHKKRRKRIPTMSVLPFLVKSPFNPHISRSAHKNKTKTQSAGNVLLSAISGKPVIMTEINHMSRKSLICDTHKGNNNNNNIMPVKNFKDKYKLYKNKLDSNNNNNPNPLPPSTINLPRRSGGSKSALSHNGFPQIIFTPKLSLTSLFHSPASNGHKNIVHKKRLSSPETCALFVDDSNKFLTNNSNYLTVPSTLYNCGPTSPSNSSQQKCINDSSLISASTPLHSPWKNRTCRSSTTILRSKSCKSLTSYNSSPQLLPEKSNSKNTIFKKFETTNNTNKQNTLLFDKSPINGNISPNSSANYSFMEYFGENPSNERPFDNFFLSNRPTLKNDEIGSISSFSSYPTSETQNMLEAYLANDSNITKNVDFSIQNGNCISFSQDVLDGCRDIKFLVPDKSANSDVNAVNQCASVKSETSLLPYTDEIRITDPQIKRKMNTNMLTRREFLPPKTNSSHSIPYSLSSETGNYYCINGYGPKNAFNGYIKDNRDSQTDSLCTSFNDKCIPAHYSNPNNFKVPYKGHLKDSFHPDDITLKTQANSKKNYVNGNNYNNNNNICITNGHKNITSSINNMNNDNDITSMHDRSNSSLDICNLSISPSQKHGGSLKSKNRNLLFTNNVCCNDKNSNPFNGHVEIKPKDIVNGNSFNSLLYTRL